MKRFLIIIFTILFITCCAVFAEIMKATISVDSVPKSLFGSWQVDAQLEKTNNYSTFKTQSKDLWNLSRVGNVIKLENPFTKASAEVELKHTEGNVVVFYKESTFDNKLLRDTVTLRLNGDTFGGYNDIIIETLSLYDGHIMKRDTAKYLLKGRKIGGDNILKNSSKK